MHPYAHNRAYKYSTPTRGELNPHVTVSGNNARNPPGGLTQHKAEERPHRYGTINKPIPARSRQGSEHARKPNLPNPIYQRYLVIQFIPMHTSTGKIRHCRHHPGGPAVRRAADVAAARRLKRRRKRCVAGAAAAATTACMRDDEQWRYGSGTFAPSHARGAGGGAQGGPRSSRCSEAAAGRCCLLHRGEHGNGAARASAACGVRRRRSHRVLRLQERRRTLCRRARR